MNVDIVITSFNRRGKISKAIESALVFIKHCDGRVIVVDDASTDGTIEMLVNTFDVAIKNNKLLIQNHKINQGVTAAKNTGYISSNADWVIFLDSDDTIISGKESEGIKVLLENIQAPIVFFRCFDKEGKVVGVPFKDDKWLSLSEYLRHTSYGEALTAINRKLILHAPYVAELRGYEGIGCARIIRDYGNALLSNLILREYDQSGSDRLSSGWSFARRLGILAKGHSLFLREFYKETAFGIIVKYIIKIIVYYFASIFVKIVDR